MLRDLVVVAAHGQDYIENCLYSLGDRYDVMVVDTGSPTPIKIKDRDHTWLHRMPYQTYGTGAALWAYENVPARNYLFIHDSMTAMDDNYVEPFRKKLPASGGAVAWTTFTDGFATKDNQEYGRYFLPVDAYPPAGIFGCVFYVSRTSLDVLAANHFLPPVSRTKEHEMSNERLWPWAFNAAGLPVESLCGQWNQAKMIGIGYPPFQKTWAGRL